MEKKRIVLMLAIMMIASFVYADRYKVLYVNATGIKIDKKNVVVGNEFSDKDIIEWTDDQQAMKVVNLNTNRIVVLAAKALKKKNVSSLYDYLTSTKHLSTRDMKKKRMLEEWQLDSTLYLMDTLYISMPQRQSKSVVAKVIVRQETVKEIPLSHNGQYYILTRSIYGNSSPHPIKIDIIEYDPILRWEYTVYRNLIIEPLRI